MLTLSYQFGIIMYGNQYTQERDKTIEEVTVNRKSKQTLKFYLIILPAACITALAIGLTLAIVYMG